MKLFEIKAPDGRTLRQEHASLETLKGALMPGYEVTGTVFGAATDATGGLVEKIGGPSLMTILLETHGEELLAWLFKSGKIPSVSTMNLTLDASKVAEAIEAGIAKASA